MVCCSVLAYIGIIKIIGICKSYRHSEWGHVDIDFPELPHSSTECDILHERVNREEIHDEEKIKILFISTTATMTEDNVRFL